MFRHRARSDSRNGKPYRSPTAYDLPEILVAFPTMRAQSYVRFAQPFLGHRMIY
ncbi:uncharacterized protein METZ01_LOCUS354889, partial [marine metagenome]